MAILNMVYGGKSYKTYTELKAMSLSDALTELNKDAQGYYDNLNGNLRIYDTYFIGNDSNDGAYIWGGTGIMFFDGEWMEGEIIVIKMKTDANGDLKIPVAGRNRGTTQDAKYNWKVSYDGGSETIYSGTGSKSAITIGSGLIADTSHIVTIRPVSNSYGWALAFGFYDSGVQTLLQSIIYDGSYKGYGVSGTNTGHYFRNYQYCGCTSLTTAPEEVLPISVTSILDTFRAYQYYGCTSLTTAPEEVLPISVTSIGHSFRYQQYMGCVSLNEIKGWIDLSMGGTNYRRKQFNNCNTNKTVKVLSNVGYASYDNNTLNNTYVTQVQVPSAYLQNFIDATTYPRSAIDDSKFVGY